MYAIATFLIVAAITLVFTRLATGGLIATGMPAETAAFQARSAFSGAGFTTTEAENVVNHPVRRRIITVTMFVGSLGTPTLVVTVMVGLLAPGPGSTTERTLVLAAGLIVVVLTVLNRPVNRLLERVGAGYASRRLVPSLEGTSNELLAISDGLVVVSARLTDDDERLPRSLREIDRVLPGVTVLGVRHKNDVISERPSDVSLDIDDELILSGPRERFVELGLLPDAD